MRNLTADAAAVGLDGGISAEWLAASPAAQAGVAADGRLAWANAAAMRLLGLATDAAGRPLAALLRLQPGEAPALDATLASGGTLELPLRTGEGAARWLAIEVQPLAGGLRLLSLQRIDRSRAAEAEVARLTELLDLVRESGRIGLWERDLPSGRGRWDRNVFRMMGLEGEGESPRWPDVQQNVHEADREMCERHWIASTQQPGSYSYRVRIHVPDGSLRHLHSRWQVHAGPDGRPERALGIITDETEAWTLARSHDETASQLALAVDLARIAIWRHDLATDRMHLTARGWSVMGRNSDPAGVPIAESRALIHPEDLPQVLASAEAALKGDRPTDTETRYRRPDGGWRTVLTRRAVQRDADGRALAFIGVALDISDRIDQSRRAAELGRRFELVTRVAGIGWWTLEARAERPVWSDQMRALHGLGADDPVPTLDEWLPRFVHPEDVDTVRQRTFDWLKSEQPNLESSFRIVRSDGQLRHLVTHSRIEGRVPEPLLFGVAIDVTDRRLAERALHEASQRALLAARGAGLGTWELDLRDGSAYWDEQMWRLRGLEPRPEAPDDEGRMALVHPDDREFLRQAMRRATEHEQTANYEFRVLWPDGRVRWLASRSTHLRDDQGRPIRHIGVNWDVTDRRTAEAERHEREVAQRESLAKSKFLARMSHELRTPLNAVLGFTQLLMREADATDAALRQRRLQHIESAGQHLLDLINDVLDLSSLEGGEVRIAVQPVPLAPLVAETLPLLEPLLREHQVQLHTGVLDVVALGDATRLRQVLLNLLSNAIKYNRPGGRVTLEAAQRGSGVIVRVADTGRGMTDQQMRHLFEPFNRLGIEGEAIEGTGIGLAIVKALVERMGGSVHVDSTLGAGSLFELRLADGSAQPGAAPAAPPAGRPLPLPGTRPRGSLLYIEDNPVNAQIIRELIARRPDLQLEVAVDGLSGVARAVELRPDLVLLDMQLPDIDGQEVLRRLRADPATAAIPVIALSANAMPDDIERALRAGLSDYWTKPLDFRAFMASIEQLFGPAPG